MCSSRTAGQVRLCAIIIAATMFIVGSPSASQTTDRSAMIAAARESVPDDTGKKTTSPYFFVWGHGDRTDAMPLQSTSALVDVTGVIANVQIEQVYKNNGKTPLEAIYIFPMSTRAAVHAMTMTVADRTVRAKIKKREDARKTYDEAKRAGKTASLLEQRRPNVFEMNIAGIEPGDEIVVEISYTELLVPTDGRYEFVFPTVVGPRYGGVDNPTLQDPDNWISSPHLHEGQGQLFDFDLDVHITSPIPIASAHSPSHQIHLDYESSTELHLDLTESQNPATSDFVLRYTLAGDMIQSGMLTYEGDKENYFLMMVEPPARTRAADRLPREYVFILDISGSMGGFPLEVSKRLMTDIIQGLGPQDYFNILLFAGGNAVFSESSVKANRRNIERGTKWIANAQGGGGTQLLSALKRALNLPKPEGISRIVTIATDGYVTVEKKAFNLIESKLGEANLFAFGIGSSANRELIEVMARAGMGEPFVVLNENEAATQANRFRRYISSPVLTDIQVSMGDFRAYDVVPRYVPDLFASRPLVIHGKYRGQPNGLIKLSGETSNGPWGASVDASKAKPSADNRAIGHLWARKAIRSLADQEAAWGEVGAKKKITSLGLKYGLMTAYTSFVAVDERVRGDGTKQRTVRQPIALPGGVSDNAVGTMMGNASGSNFGYGGLGIRGTGRGGGATGAGTIGLGSLNTVGHGGGSGSGYGRSAGGVSSPGPKIRSGNARMKGSLSNDVIRRIIHRHMNAARFCYEKQLSANPKLAGQVVLNILVKEDGTVQSVTVHSTTLGNPKVESCLVRAFKRITFPSQPGLGITIIKYPFIFKTQ